MTDKIIGMTELYDALQRTNDKIDNLALEIRNTQANQRTDIELTAARTKENTEDIKQIRMERERERIQRSRDRVATGLAVLSAFIIPVLLNVLGVTGKG